MNDRNNQPGKRENDLPSELAELLVDYNLGQVDDHEAEQVRRLIAENPSAARMDQTLRITLKVLDSYEAQAAPEHLPEKILQAVRQASQPSGVEFKPAARKIFSLREVFAAAASVAVIVALSFSYANRARFEARRLQCQANLGAVSKGITAYANEFPDQLPYVALPSGAGWYEPATGKFYRPHLFLLVKRNFVRPGDLICPGTNHRAVPADVIYDLDDFPANNNVSFSFQNLFGDDRFTPQQRLRRVRLAPAMPIMADRAPMQPVGRIKITLMPSQRSLNHPSIHKWVLRGTTSGRRGTYGIIPARKRRSHQRTRF